MFAGTVYAMMDAKGRLVIPAHFRRKFGSEAVLTYGAEGCLLVLPRGQWDRLAKRHKRDGEFGVVFLSGATVAKIDPHTGRVLVPAALREYAGLQPGVEVAFAGIGEAVAVSPSTRWSSLLRATETRLVGALIGGPVRSLPPLWSDLVTGRRAAPVR